MTENIKTYTAKSERKILNQENKTAFGKAIEEWDFETAGIIKISGYANSKFLMNNSKKKYRINSDEIENIARNITNRGIKSIIIHSGDDEYFDSDLISHIIFSVKDTADVKILLSCGIRSLEELRSWKIAGASEYFLHIKQDACFNDEVYRMFFIKLTKTGLDVGIMIDKDLSENYFAKIKDMSGKSVKYFFFDSFDKSKSELSALIKKAKENYPDVSIIISEKLFRKHKKYIEKEINRKSDLLAVDFTPLKYC